MSKLIVNLSRALIVNSGTSGINLSRDKVAVAIAVDKKVITAANDLRENLGIPHNPWPLVQPLDSSVPIPTSNPETIKRVTELPDEKLVESKGKDSTKPSWYNLLTKADIKTSPSTTRALDLVSLPTYYVEVPLGFLTRDPAIPLTPKIPPNI